MIAIVIFWFLLLLPAVVLGRLILSALGAERTTLYWEPVYLGLILLAAGGLFLPRPWMVLVLGWGLVAYDGIRNRRISLRLPCPVGPVVAIAALVSAVAVGLVSSRDSITYQYDLIYALSRNGVTPGLAWIHNRFGHLSSWLALPAMLEPFGMAGRTATSANALLMFLALCHLTCCIYRVKRNEADVADRFWVMASLVSLPLCAYMNLPVSATPDYAVIIYTSVLVYLWLKDDPHGTRSQCAMLIAAALVAVKLSALPLLAAAAVIAWRRKGNLQAWIVPAGCSALLIGAWMVASCVNSGYPLFPKTVMSPDVAWRIPEALAEKETATVKGFAFWGQLVKPDAMQTVSVYSLRWFKHWLGFNAMNVVGATLWLLGVASVPVVIFVRKGLRVLWPALLAWGVGVVFLMFVAPATRFGLGILVCLPAAAAAWVWHSYFGRSPAFSSAIVALLVIAACVLPTWLWRTRSEHRIARAQEAGQVRIDPVLPRLWRPPLIPHLHYDEARNIAWLPHPERSHNRPGACDWTRKTWYRFERCPAGAMFRSTHDWRSGIVRAH